MAIEMRDCELGSYHGMWEWDEDRVMREDAWGKGIDAEDGRRAMALWDRFLFEGIMNEAWLLRALLCLGRGEPVGAQVFEYDGQDGMVYPRKPVVQPGEIGLGDAAGFENLG